MGGGVSYEQGTPVWHIQDSQGQILALADLVFLTWRVGSSVLPNCMCRSWDFFGVNFDPIVTEGIAAELWNPTTRLYCADALPGS